MASGIDKVSTVVALFALVGSTYAVVLAQRADNRLERQEMEQYASKIRLREANAAEYQVLGKSSGLTTWVVVNLSGAQAEQVWVKDDSGSYYRVQGLEPCSYYAFDPGFHPTHLYFVDAVGEEWYVRYGEKPSREGFASLPPPNGNSARNGVLADCTG